MKWKFLSITFLVICMACDNAYLKVNDDSGNEITRSSQKDQLVSNEGVAFYLIKDFSLQSNIDFDSITLESDPFISYDDIVAYDSVAHVFEVDLDANTFFCGDDNLDERGFALMADSDTLYCGVLFSPIHSQIYDNVVMTLYSDESIHENYLEIISAYPSAVYATDPVKLNDNRLIDCLVADEKLKTLIGSSETDEQEPSTGETDTMYYATEIFDEVYQTIYGKWKLNTISGGFTGNGYDPDFEYLNFVEYGIYQFINADTLLEFGKIVIEEQLEDTLRISLQPDTGSTVFFYDSEKYVELTGDDLDLVSPCCDRYNYHFTREE